MQELIINILLCVVIAISAGLLVLSAAVKAV